MRELFKKRFVSKILYNYRYHRDAPTNTSAFSQESTRSTGIKIVYEGSKPVVDVVAIHGLGGDWKKSWTDSVTGTFWLQDLLPTEISEVRVLSFGYEASRTSTIPLEDIASSLLGELVQIRRDRDSEGRPIIFLAHSLGGPILKGALASSLGHDRSETSKIRISTCGILFFGIAKRAEDAYSKLAALIAQDDRNGSKTPETTLMKILEHDLVWLREMGAGYSRISSGFATKYFVESGNNMTTVEPHDRADITEVDSITLGKSHGQMIQYPNKEDCDYRKVSKCLLAMFAEIVKDDGPRASKDIGLDVSTAEPSH